MDVRQLTAFLAVAEELHFGRAAQRVFMAQSPLSRTIRSLETELGAVLFIRSTRSVTITPAGEALLEPARRVIDAVAAAESSIQSALRGDIGHVRIDFTGMAAHPIVAELARTMSEHYPDIEIGLTSRPVSRPSMQHLVDGGTDLALGLWDIAPAEVSMQVMVHDSLVVALPARHALSAEASVSFAQVKNERWVSLPYTAGSITTDRLWRLGYNHGIAINNVQFAPDTNSCIALVSAGVGCHLALRSVGLRSANSDVVFVPLDADDAAHLPDVHLKAAWRTAESAPAVTRTRDILLSRAQTPPAPTPSTI